MSFRTGKPDLWAAVIRGRDRLRRIRAVAPVAVAAVALPLLAAPAPEASAALNQSLWPVPGPSRADGSYRARLVAPVRVTERPGAGPVVTRLPTFTSWSRQPQTLLVLGSRETEHGRWLKVLLPVRPTPSKGWIPRDRVVLGYTPLWIEVNKGWRFLAIIRRGVRMKRYRVVIGAAGTPTPAGISAVYERNRQADPGGFLGPWALPLTSLSRTLRRFGGGPGRIAIHGRAGSSLLHPLGSARSHGCIRMPNRGIRWLARNAPPGTPVRIRN